jgi:hypothetical protein
MRISAGWWTALRIWQSAAMQSVAMVCALSGDSFIVMISGRRNQNYGNLNRK